MIPPENQASIEAPKQRKDFDRLEKRELVSCDYPFALEACHDYR
jgi:hypothetical protein